MKCPLLTPSRWFPTKLQNASSLVQLWSHCAPASLSAVIRAINLAECPLYVVCIAFLKPAPSLLLYTYYTDWLIWIQT